MVVAILGFVVAIFSMTVITSFSADSISFINSPGSNRMNLFCVGISHNSAPLDVREKLGFQTTKCAMLWHK